MPTKKRHKPSISNDDAPCARNQSSTKASRAGFASLPFELRQHILDLAFHSPSSYASSSFSSPFFRFEVDYGTMYNLALICKDVNAQVTPMLWGTVTITRLSALYALRQALLANPERSKMITSLHIGPQDTLPSYWWPLSTCYQYPTSAFEVRNLVDYTPLGPPLQWIASSLHWDRLPSGCKERQAWTWDRRLPGCQSAAVYEALKVCQVKLGLSSQHHPNGASPLIELVFEAQAALDIYLEAIRRLEDQQPKLLQLAKPGARVPLRCRNGECNHYPPLLLTEVPNASDTDPIHQPSPSAPTDPVAIPYWQVLCHLARPGSLIDRFDHPFVLARSGFGVVVDAPVLHSSTGYSPSRANYTLNSDTWRIDQHEACQWKGSGSLQEAAKSSTLSDEHAASLARTIATATVGSVLPLARGVLCSARNVENLSLTGCLESALLDKQPMPRLRRLSLGPTLAGWDAPFSVVELDRAEELRICGPPLSTYEVEAVADNMPKLKKLHWSMAERFYSHFSESLTQLVDDVLKNEPIYSFLEAEPLVTAAEQHAASTSRTDAPKIPLIVARLHEADVAEVLDSAASPEIRAAWLKGQAVDGYPRRLLLQHSTAAAAANDSNRRQDSQSAVWDEMYEEGRDFWRGKD